MRRHACLGVLVASTVFSSNLFAQNSEVPIISEQLQRIAIETNVSGKLGINWNEASSEDTGEYFGFLAAAAAAAERIAEVSEREVPESGDYEAALSLYCVWPPHQPPKHADVAKFRPLLYPAFYDESLRTDISSAVGPVAFKISDILVSAGESKFIQAMQTGEIIFPSSMEEYNELIFNFSVLDKQN